MLKRFARFIAWSVFRWLDTTRKLRCVGEPFFWLVGGRRRSGHRTPARVAIIKLDRLGDLVLCSQLLAGLRRGWPQAYITLIVRDSLVDLARLCPDVNEVVGVPVDEAMMFKGRVDRQRAIWRQFCAVGRAGRRRFDMALVPRWEVDLYGSAWLAYLTGAPQRLGASEKATEGRAIINRGIDRLLTRALPGPCVQHEFLLNESFLPALGLAVPAQQLVPWASKLDREKAAPVLTAAGVDLSKKAIVLCLGAGAGCGHKTWPVESYAVLCRTVFNFEKVQLLTFGTASEADLGLRLKQRLGNVVVGLEGVIPLCLLPAAISFGSLYVGSDTGLKHVAAAAGMPVFEICCHPLGGDPNWVLSPRRFGPWGIPNRVVQPAKAAPPCNKNCASSQPHCILGVSPEQASDELLLLLKETDLQGIRRSGASAVMSDPSPAEVCRND